MQAAPKNGVEGLKGNFVPNATYWLKSIPGFICNMLDGSVYNLVGDFDWKLTTIH